MNVEEKIPAADADFETAFDDLTLPKGDEKAEEVVAAEAAEAEAAESKAEEKVEEPKAEETVVEEPKAEETPAEKAEETPAVEEPKADDADEILARLSKLVKEAPAPKAEEKPAEEKQVEAEALPDLYSEDDKAFLADYEKDWGDVKRGEALIRKAEYRELLQYVFAQVADFVRPIQETAQVLATRTHLSDIETVVPDYSDQLREDVTKWVETQPAYLQAAYNQVITQGTVEEVKDLIDRYRGATGKGATTSQSATPKKDNELSGAAKQAAAALAPVESKRSGVQAPEDPSNFDDAWKQASAELG